MSRTATDTDPTEPTLPPQTEPSRSTRWDPFAEHPIFDPLSAEWGMDFYAQSAQLRDEIRSLAWRPWPYGADGGGRSSVSG